jgi:hypothetical protein
MSSFMIEVKKGIKSLGLKYNFSICACTQIRYKFYLVLTLIGVM